MIAYLKAHHMWALPCHLTLTLIEDVQGQSFEKINLRSTISSSILNQRSSLTGSRSIDFLALLRFWTTQWRHKGRQITYVFKLLFVVDTSFQVHFIAWLNVPHMWFWPWHENFPSRSMIRIMTSCPWSIRQPIGLWLFISWRIENSSTMLVSNVCMSVC